MSSDVAESVRWMEFGIICPHCGNRGQEGESWEANCWHPFRLIEDVVRSFLFVPPRYQDGSVLLVTDTDSDKVDWESGTGFRLECMQCFKEFALPEGFEIEFD